MANGGPNGPEGKNRQAHAGTSYIDPDTGKTCVYRTLPSGDIQFVNGDAETFAALKAFQEQEQGFGGMTEEQTVNALIAGVDKDKRFKTATVDVEVGRKAVSKAFEKGGSSSGSSRPPAAPGGPGGPEGPSGTPGEALDRVKRESYPGHKLVEAFPNFFNKDSDKPAAIGQCGLAVIAVSTNDVRRMPSPSGLSSVLPSHASHISTTKLPAGQSGNVSLFVVDKSVAADTVQKIEKSFPFCKAASETRHVHGIVHGAGVTLVGPGITQVMNELKAAHEDAKEIAAAAEKKREARANRRDRVLADGSYLGNDPEVDLAPGGVKMSVDLMEVPELVEGIEPFVGEIKLSGISEVRDFKFLAEVYAKFASFARETGAVTVEMHPEVLRVFHYDEKPTKTIRAIQDFASYLKTANDTREKQGKNKIHLGGKIAPAKFSIRRVGGSAAGYISGSYAQTLDKLDALDGEIAVHKGLLQFDSRKDKRHPELEYEFEEVEGKNVLCITKYRSVDNLVEAMQTPEFVGRTNELKQIQDVYVASSKEMQFTLVSGLAGSGKTTLVAKAMAMYSSLKEVQDAPREVVDEAVATILEALAGLEDSLPSTLAGKLDNIRMYHETEGDAGMPTSMVLLELKPLMKHISTDHADVVLCRGLNDLTVMKDFVSRLLARHDALAAGGSVMPGHSSVSMYLKNFVNGKDLTGKEFKYNESTFVENVYQLVYSISSLLKEKKEKYALLLDDFDDAGIRSLPMLQAVMNKLKDSRKRLGNITLFATKRSERDHAKGDMRAVVDDMVGNIFDSEVKVDEWVVVSFDKTGQPNYMPEFDEFVGKKLLGEDCPKEFTLSDDDRRKIKDLLTVVYSGGDDGVFTEPVKISPYVFKDMLEIFEDRGFLVVDKASGRITVDHAKYLRRAEAVKSGDLPMGVARIYEYQFARLAKSEQSALMIVAFMQGIDNDLLDALVPQYADIFADLRSRGILHSYAVGMHGLWREVAVKHGQANQANLLREKERILQKMRAFKSPQGPEGTPHRFAGKVKNLGIFELAIELKDSYLRLAGLASRRGLDAELGYRQNAEANVGHAVQVAEKAAEEAIFGFEYDKAIKAASLMFEAAKAANAPKEGLIAQFLLLKANIFKGDLAEAEKFDVFVAKHSADLPHSRVYEYQNLALELDYLRARNLENANNPEALGGAISSFEARIESAKELIRAQLLKNSGQKTPALLSFEMEVMFKELQAKSMRGAKGVLQGDVASTDKQALIKALYDDILKLCNKALKALDSLIRGEQGSLTMKRRDAQVMRAEIGKIYAATLMTRVSKLDQSGEEGLITRFSAPGSHEKPENEKIVTLFRRVNQAVEYGLATARRLGGLRGDMALEAEFAMLSVNAANLSCQPIEVVQKAVKRGGEFWGKVGAQHHFRIAALLGDIASKRVFADERLDDAAVSYLLNDVYLEQSESLHGEIIFDIESKNRRKASLMDRYVNGLDALGHKFPALKSALGVQESAIDETQLIEIKQALSIGDRPAIDRIVRAHEGKDQLAIGLFLLREALLTGNDTAKAILPDAVKAQLAAFETFELPDKPGKDERDPYASLRRISSSLDRLDGQISETEGSLSFPLYNLIEAKLMKAVFDRNASVIDGVDQDLVRLKPLLPAGYELAYQQLIAKVGQARSYLGRPATPGEAGVSRAHVLREVFAVAA